MVETTRFFQYWLIIILPAIWATLRMLVASMFLGFVIGTAIGVFMAVISPFGLRPQPRLYRLVGFIINMIRSFPVIILIVAMSPVTRLLVGTSIGEKAAIVPLTLAAFPVIARQIEASLLEVNPSVVLAARSFGAGIRQIVFKVLFVEALPSIIAGMTTITILFLASTTLAGAVGAGGLGAVALTYGYQRFDNIMMYAIVGLLFVMVVLIQGIGELLYRKSKHKRRGTMKHGIVHGTALLLACWLLLAGCSKADPRKETGTGKTPERTIACVETTQALVHEAVPYMRDKGYQIKYTMFDNNRNTLTALHDGSVDAVFVVHKPFMESFNEANGADLIMAEPYIYTVGMGLFSDKYERIDAIPPGATITLANDAMNMDRGFRILASAGLITLNPGVERATIIDIQDNPKKLTIIDMDQTQLVRTLESADGTVAFFSHMKNAGKDFTKYLARDEDLTKYPTGVVIKPAHRNEPWVADLVEVLRSDAMKKFAQEYYGGLYEYYE